MESQAEKNTRTGLILDGLDRGRNVGFKALLYDLHSPDTVMHKLDHVHITSVGEYKVGDPMPDGYLDRQEWAEVHIKAGLKQEECCHCCKWKFPHELSKRRQKCTATYSNGKPTGHTLAVCRECD